MEKYNVQLEAWAPLGRANSGIFDEEILRGIAAAHDKTPAKAHVAKYNCNPEIESYRTHERKSGSF